MSHWGFSYVQCWKWDFPLCMRTGLSRRPPLCVAIHQREEKPCSDQWEACFCCDIMENQTAQADKHTDIHKNQYSSTPFITAALIKLPHKIQGLLCVCLFVWRHHSKGEYRPLSIRKLIQCNELWILGGWLIAQGEDFASWGCEYVKKIQHNSRYKLY